LALTTGSTVFEAGGFTGFSVDGGTMFIGESGLDASEKTRFDLISRQLTLGGPVVDNDIRVVAGGDPTIAADGSVSLTGEALTLTAGRILT
jgi:filamentous hemagglutinin